LQKANLNQETNGTTANGTTGGNTTTTTTSTLPQIAAASATDTSTVESAANSLAPLAQLLTKPNALSALNSLSALNGLSDLVAGLANLSGAATSVTGAASTGPRVQTTGVYRKNPYNSRVRNTITYTDNSNGNNTGGSSKKSERNKFNPY
jgi:hypothetical protein